MKKSIKTKRIFLNMRVFGKIIRTRLIKYNMIVFSPRNIENMTNNLCQPI